MSYHEAREPRMKFFHAAILEGESIDQYRKRWRSVFFKWMLGVAAGYVLLVALFVHLVHPGHVRDPLDWAPFLGALAILPTAWFRRRYEQRYVEEIEDRLRKAGTENPSRLTSN